MKKVLFLFLVFIVDTSNYVFPQCGNYYELYVSNKNEYTVKVLCVNEDSTYQYLSLYCNSNGVWKLIDSSEGKWSVINRYTLELKTYDYIAANNETKKLLRILNGPDYLSFPYMTLKIHKHQLINKQYSTKPLVRWKQLSLKNQDKNKLKKDMMESFGFPSSFFD